jgi:NAD(P)H dehydrogenase (quinone)
MVQVAIIYHSGYGHTAKVAEAIVDGVKQSEASVDLIRADEIKDADWDTLDKADAIIFGAPTYMGSVSGPFKVFMDATSKKWMTQAWKDKVAAGFTNSGSYSGDKFSSIQQLFTLAMQHGMIWVGVGDLPPTFEASEIPTHEMVNRLGSFSGLMTQANQKAGPDIAPPFGDLETARRFGKRIVTLTNKLAHAT